MTPHRPRPLLRSALLCTALALSAAPAAHAERLSSTVMTDLTDGAGGTVTGSGNYLNGSAAYGHANAFDNVYGADNSRVIFAAATGWVTYDFPSATVVDAFTVRVPDWNVATRSPKRFTLSGSNDGGATWTVLDEETDQTGWSKQEVRAYGFENETAYLAYKFEVLEDNGEGKAQISELELCRAADARMMTFVWQPTGFASGSWTNDACWVGASALSPSVPHWPTGPTTVSFSGVRTPDVVVEIPKHVYCLGLDFSGTGGLTNLVFHGTGETPVLQFEAQGGDSTRFVWPSSGDFSLTFDGVRFHVSNGKTTNAGTVGTLVLRNGATIDAYRRWSIGSNGTQFHLRLETGTEAALQAFWLAAGSTLTLDDAAFYPRAMNLTGQGQTVPGSVRIGGAAPILAPERLIVSAAGVTGDVVFDVPASGWTQAPIQQVPAPFRGGNRELTEPLSNGDGSLRFSIDPACGFYVAARRPAAIPIATWESGIRADRIELAPLRNGSSWRWGYGTDGQLGEPAAAGDLPTALWADLVPNNRPTVIVVK